MGFAYSNPKYGLSWNGTKVERPRKGYIESLLAIKYIYHPKVYPFPWRDIEELIWDMIVQALKHLDKLTFDGQIKSMDDISHTYVLKS